MFWWQCFGCYKSVILRKKFQNCQFDSVLISFISAKIAVVPNRFYCAAGPSLRGAGVPGPPPTSGALTFLTISIFFCNTNITRNWQVQYGFRMRGSMLACALCSNIKWEENICDEQMSSRSRDCNASCLHSSVCQCRRYRPSNPPFGKGANITWEALSFL